MEKFIDFMQKHKWKGLIALILSALAIIFLNSCSIAKYAESTSKVSDTHTEKEYSIELQK